MQGLQAAIYILKATGVYGFSEEETADAVNEQETTQRAAESKGGIEVQWSNQVARPRPTW